MKLNVVFSPLFTEELFFAKKNTAVIDVLRATSTIVTALSNGAREVIPVASVEFAMQVSTGMFSGMTILGGERNTKKIEGFLLGNSPREYESSVVNGKSIVFFTTNGSKAIVKARFSTNLFITSFLNLTASAKKLVELNEDINIVCAGRNNSFSLEDSTCAGMLAREILKLSNNYEMNDEVRTGLLLADKFEGDLIKMMKESDHGKILIDNGFEEDINFCAQKDIYELLPRFASNTIKIS